MIEHLDSKSYRSFLAKAIGLPADTALADLKRLRELYRITSNTTHGKVSTHKVLLGDGFSYIPAEWSECLDVLGACPRNSVGRKFFPGDLKQILR
jgi:hypothetical protein